MGEDYNVRSKYEKLNDALSSPWVSKDKIMVKLTGKYVEVAMHSYGVQIKMWKWP
jgi:hypothetical protein